MGAIISKRRQRLISSQYPVHIQNLSSIQDLEARVPKKTGYTPDSRRFRANVYISGPPAYLENDITRMSIQPQKSSINGTTSNGTASNLGSQDGPILFAVSSRTPRCTMPNNNPSDATRGKENEPLRTMRTYLIIDEGIDHPCLGMHAVPLAKSIARTISVGDEVIFDGKGEHLYVKDPAKEAHKEVW
jgi:uncharacterized protein YcbX